MKTIAELLVETTARLSCVVERNTTYEGVVWNCFQDIPTSAEMAREIVARVYGPPCEEAAYIGEFEFVKIERARPGEACGRCGWPFGLHGKEGAQ